MEDFSITIPGLKAFEDSIERAGQSTPAELHRAMVASTILVTNESKQLVRKKTRALMQSILPMVQDNPVRGTITVNQPYGAHVEYGTKAHVITPRRAKALAFMGKGGMVFAKKVNHPGTKPSPFLQPAMENNEGKIVELFRQAMQRVLNKVQGNY